MLVMNDRCDSMADQNEADVVKLKHSSCVELHEARSEKSENEGGKKTVLKVMMKLLHIT